MEACPGISGTPRNCSLRAYLTHLWRTAMLATLGALAGCGQDNSTLQTPATTIPGRKEAPQVPHFDNLEEGQSLVGLRFIVPVHTHEGTLHIPVSFETPTVLSVGNRRFPITGVLYEGVTYHAGETLPIVGCTIAEAVHAVIRDHGLTLQGDAAHAHLPQEEFAEIIRTLHHSETSAVTIQDIRCTLYPQGILQDMASSAGMAVTIPCTCGLQFGRANAGARPSP